MRAFNTKTFSVRHHTKLRNERKHTIVHDRSDFKQRTIVTAWGYIRSRTGRLSAGRRYGFCYHIRSGSLIRPPDQIQLNTLPRVHLGQSAVSNKKKAVSNGQEIPLRSRDRNVKVDTFKSQIERSRVRTRVPSFNTWSERTLWRVNNVTRILSPHRSSGTSQ